MSARLFLICGMPGAGKTTLAVRLAAQHGAVRMCPDDWFLDLGLDPNDEPLRARIERLQWRQTQELLALGVPVVVEFGFWSGPERDEKRLVARQLGVPVELRVLDVPLDERWRRLAARTAEQAGVPVTRADLQTWEQFWDLPGAAELALFDPPSTISNSPVVPGC